MDPTLDSGRVQSIVIVLAAAVTSAIADVGNQLVIADSIVWVIVQENPTT
jgi:hypothetical protein